MAACKINLVDLVTQEAQRQGVDPSIALAVARQESGICQWRADGSVITSSAGATGVMQLEPATAAALGVDPYDVNQNIRGGVTYLKQLYQKYGSWQQALAAYNFGPGNVDSGKNWPSETLNYVKAILGISTVYSAASGTKASAAATAAPNTADITSASILANVLPSSSKKVPITAAIVVGGVVIAAWVLSD
jgi:soluble lytic murein transglycosylase-like protein